MSTDRTPLERAMNQRRLELGLQWTDILIAAGDGDRRLGPETLRRLRVQGTPDAISELRVSRIERALRWLPGSIARVADGLEPLPEPDRPVEPATTTPDPDVTLTRVEHPTLHDDETLVYVPGRKPGTRIYGLTVADETGAQYRFAKDTPLETVIRELRKLAGVVRAASPD
jgi:hypothetical protein